MDDFLACELELRSGDAPVRFGPDESDPGDLPQKIGFSTANPRGYSDGSVTLARPPWIRAEDAPLFGSAKFYGPGGKTRYEGRVKGTPQIGVNDIRIDFEGWAAHLADDEAFRLLGVHSDLNGWGAASVQRKLDLIGVGVNPQDPSVESDSTGLPSLVTRLTDEWSTDSVCEAWLYVEGMPLGPLYFAWKRNDNVDDTNGSWEWQGYLSTDDTLTSSDTTGDLRAAGPGSGSLAPTTTRKHAMVRLRFDTAAGSAGVDHAVYWPVLSQFGAHGLTPRAIADGRYGLLGSDVLRYAIPAGAPLLNIGSIDDSTHVFPHLVHDSTVQSLVEHINGFGGATKELNDWGVYDNREFFWKAPGWGRTWRVRRDQCVIPNEEGPVGDERCTGVFVTYQDGSGKTKTVGPPGSGADTETALLEDTDPSNPASRLNGTRRKREDAGITTEDGAIFVGQALLAEQNANTRRGSATISGYVTDDAGNEEPACAVRACDRILVEDEEGVSPQIQPIVATSFDQDSLTVTADLGATPHRGEILLAQLLASTPG